MNIFTIVRIQKFRYHSRIVILFLLVQQAEGQHHLDQWQKIDVQHYDFSISLSDTSDIIYSSARINMVFKEPFKSFSLDLADKDKQGKGMVVKRVTVNGKESRFRHQNDSLYIYFNCTKANTYATFNIEYSGIPASGLIISENKFGDRTFFGDNWPDRAHNWLPCVDSPYDKATVEFKVSAPDYYQVIASGDMVEEILLDNHYKLTHWQSDETLPTKVMVIGVARFAIDTVENNLNIPVTTWVYPQNADEGFADYMNATEPLSFFITQIGPYPFSKLANVQSTTEFGGMENAGNIFYRENLVTGNQRLEGTIVHEIAHQWFGNSVTEGNWHDVWLSEGFSTYLTDLYYEDKYGQDVFKSRMRSERNSVIRYAKRNYSPVIDTTVTDYMSLLNPNSYEKGGWFLHMLRKESGDELFMECIRTFYEKYKYSNALTADFQNIVDSLAAKDMNIFFDQWLSKPGNPVLNISWYQKKKNVLVKIEQLQKSSVFDFTLDLEFVSKDGSMKTVTMQVNKANETYSFPVEGKTENLVPDPDVWLLYEGKVTRKKF
jgi:aminopeptidase N